MFFFFFFFFIPASDFLTKAYRALRVLVSITSSTISNFPSLSRKKSQTCDGSVMEGWWKRDGNVMETHSCCRKSSRARNTKNLFKLGMSQFSKILAELGFLRSSKRHTAGSRWCGCPVSPGRALAHRTHAFLKLLQTPPGLRAIQRSASSPLLQHQNKNQRKLLQKLNFTTRLENRARNMSRNLVAVLCTKVPGA